MDIANYTVEWRRLRDPAWLPVLVYLYILVAVPYVVWRSTIINWHVWYGPLVYVAELYGFLTTGLFLLMAHKIFLPVHRRSRIERTVDVLVPTYTEPISILEPVIVGALAIRGVRQVLILDDGNRPEVRALASKLGARYYPRTTNLHAKAGNLNNGLQHTDAELLVLLDADHIPVAHFLERTLGYFDDSKVAFVQTPQTFYNQGTFLFRKLHGRRAGWSEQKMFYDCIQPAKNRWNSAFFVGTSAILRRSALDNVGGFATGTATEDIHTSLRLHARGWRSIFLPEPLAYGLEAENLKEFYKQRQRWAAGSLGLLFRSPDSPLYSRGLNIKQRLSYLSATLAHLQGVQKGCFFITPILAIIFTASPVRVSSIHYSLAFVIFLSVSLFTTWAYSRGTYNLLYTESYSLANMMAHFGGIKGIIKVQRKFSVSRKSIARREKTWINNVLWCLSLIALGAIVRGLWLYFIDRNHNPLIIYSLAFTAINLTILLSFLAHLHKYETGKVDTSYTVLSSVLD